MPPQMTTETRLDLDGLKKLVTTRVIPHANHADCDSPFPIEIFQRLHEMGWMQSFIPESLGGVGASALDTLCIARELAYGSGGVFSSTIINMLAMTPIILYANEDLKRKLCSDFLNRFSLWSYCMTEPDTGSNIAFAKTRAKKVPGGYLLNGQKCFITNANFSENLTVFATLENPGSTRSAITCFYIPANSKGVQRGKSLRKLGQHDSNTGELFFDNVFVPEEHRIGAEGQGLRIAFHALQKSKTMIAGAAYGTSRRCFDLVTQHLGERKIYSRPLLALPTIQNTLAKLETEARAAWLLACEAAHCWDAGREIGDYAIRQASMAKMFATDMAVKYANEALELFGGYGYSNEFEIQRIYRDCKVMEIYEGPTLVQQALISKELFPEMTERKATEEKARAA